jgi:hypoxanthine-DNA glycosylase
VKSRENNFFYGHKQNRFWKVLANLFQEEVPESIAEKKDFLLRNKVAVWDVISECDIIGSSDSSIKNVEPTDLCMILKNSQINRVFTNGKLAGKLYNTYQEEKTKIKRYELPSTSPANAAFSLDRLIEEWQVVL